MTYETLVYNISIIVISIIIDMIIGEVPNKIHPVILMGNLIDKLKNYLPNTKFSGLLTILITISVFTFISLILLIICAYISSSIII